MYKKFVCLYFFILFIGTMNVSVWALSENDVSIVFSLGKSTFLVNGKEIIAEKPFVKEGTTLVPIRVISEAFGLSIDWNDAEKSLTITSGDRKIKLFVGKREAIINNKSVPLLLEPMIVNSRTMIPIRFISENLGAEVEYNDSLKAISVVKYYVKTNSIRDYASILKSTSKEKIGDSYKNWAMSIPKSMKIQERNFDGSKNSFISADSKSIFIIGTGSAATDSLDYILSELLNLYSDKTILKQGVFSNNDYKYADIIYKDDKIVFELRKILDGKKIYSLFYATEDSKDYLSNKEIKNFLDSFETKFDNTSNKTEDLSDVNTDGYRKYENKKFKWSLDVQADYIETVEDSNTQNKKENCVDFFTPNSESLSVSMYNRDPGTTLEMLINNEKKYNNEKTNKDRYKELQSNKVTKDGKDYYYSLYKITPDIKNYYSFEVYAVGQKYKYHVSVLMNEESYKDNKKLESFKKMITSFSFSETDEAINDSFVQGVVRTKDYAYRKLLDKDYGLSVLIPDSWLSNSKNNDKDVISYSDPFDRSIIEITCDKSINYEKFVSYYEKDVLTKRIANGAFTNVSTEDIKFKNMDCKKYVNKTIISEVSYTENFYIFQKNDTFYTISILINDLNDSEYFKNAIAKIINSVEIV